MYNLSQQIISQNNGQSILTDNGIIPVNYSKWFFRIMHKSGGIKAEFWLDQDNCPITSFDLELNKKLIGSGTLEIGKLSDYPIHTDDIVEIYYKNQLVYRAITDIVIDNTSKIPLIPLSQRSKEIFWNGVYNNMLIKDILFDVVINTSSQTGYNFVTSLIDTSYEDESGNILDDPNLYTFDFSKYETVEKIFDTLVAQLQNKLWGINIFNSLVVYEYDDESTKTFLQGNDYSKIEYKKDYSKLDATRYICDRKISATDSGTQIVGTFPNEITYPNSIDGIELITRKKYKKLSLDNIFDDTQAENFVMQKISNEIRNIPETITVNNFNLNSYFPKIGEKLRFQDQLQERLRTLIYGNTINYDADVSNNIGHWSPNVTINNNDFVEGTGSIQWLTNDSTEIFYDFVSQIRLFNPSKFGFMIKIDKPINLQVSLSQLNGWSTDNNYWSNNDLYWSIGSNENTYPFDSNVHNVYVQQASVWLYVKFDITEIEKTFQRISFKVLNPNNQTILLDQISIFEDYSKLYSSNVVKVNIKVNSKQEDCKILLGEYENKVNAYIFKHEREISENRTNITK